MRLLIFLLAVVQLTFISKVHAQCSSIDFTLPSNACRQEQLFLKNLSAPATSFNWDYCSGDLNNLPQAQSFFSLPSSIGRPGIELIKDGSLWFAFATGTYTNTLYRIEFANGITSSPTSIQNLGDLSGKLNNPGQVRIIKENNLWFGFIHNTVTGELVKLDFGNSLSNSFTTSILFSGIGAGNTGFALGKDPVNGWICVISTLADQIATIRLGNNLSAPAPADILVSSAVPNANNLGDVDLINVCGSWFGFADNLGNGNVYRLDFGTSLFSIPTITQLPTVSAGNPGRLRIAKEGEEYFLMIPWLDGKFTKLKFGTDITSNPVEITENLAGNLPAGAYGLAIAKENSLWTILALSQANGQVIKITYPESCFASQKTSNQQDGQVIFTQAGTFAVTLENTTSMITTTKTKVVTVSSSAAPDIDFSSQNVCANSNVNFTSVNSSGNLISYAWNFGDTGTSGASNPSHIYTVASSVEVNLTVGASNTCSNTARKTLTIYNVPTADFTLPSTLPVCTNQNYDLLNTSTFDPGSNPVWEWRVNGSLLSNQKDLSILFNSPVAQDIRLKALLPGCSNEIIKNIGTVQIGPLVAFNANDDCEANSIGFNNTTTGANGFAWDFDDGANSLATNPSHTFTSGGIYQVKLIASNPQGCQNFIIKPITIYSLPQPDFSVGLPPFSCSKTSTPFQNNTPALTDSNIIDWQWSFGDAGGGNDNQQNPAYVYELPADYSVTLMATTDHSCSASVTKIISISPSPDADFTMTPACLNQSTKFTDISGGGPHSRFWQIGPTSFGSSAPSYSFLSSGDFTASLTIYSTNGCSSTKSRLISVPVPPSLNFAAANLCATKNALFTDLTTSASDPIVGWNWNFSGNINSGNPAEYSFSNPGTYPVKIITTHQSGCQYSISRNVIINASPVADFTAAPDRGNAPLTVQFVNTSVQATTYQWKFFDKSTVTSTQTAPAYTFVSLGDYSAQLTASNSSGCTDIKSVPIHVLVPSIDLVLKDFKLLSDPVTGKLKSVVTILNNSNVSVNSIEVSLFLSEKAVVNETFVVTLKPGESVSRQLAFTLSQNQFDFSYLCAEINGVNDIHQDNNKRCIELGEMDYFFAPYPNPMTGMVYVEWIAVQAGTAHISIYDAIGKKAYEWKTEGQSGLNQSSLDLAFLTAGIYYLSIETSGGKTTSRIIRQ